MKMKMIVLLLLISQHASGVEVYEGEESVLLPCQVPADVSRSSTAAVWDRDGFKNPTVHLRLQKSDDLDERDNLSGQNKLYQNRTSMRVDALQTGDLSLTLRKPTVSDSGTYTCITRRAGEDQSRTVVQLKVSEPPPVWPKVLAAVLVFLIILAPAFVLFAYKRMKNREVHLPEVVNVTDADGSVLLPFTTTADLPQDVTVEWTVTEPTKRKVHVYKSENNQSHNQDQDNKDRTEMNKDPLTTKDLSLTLKYPHLTDSGVYTCTVYSKHGHMLLQKSVILSVRESVPDIVQVQRPGPVELSFKTTADLPQDVTVEWRDSNDMKVHVYESGNNQPDKQDQRYRGRTEMNKDPLNTKDLSLTLKDLHLADSGVYTCTIYNKDGHKLLQKSVTLHIFDFQLEMVEVTEGEESVELPCKTTADLHHVVGVYWTVSEPTHKMVHYFDVNKIIQPNLQPKDYIGRTEMNKDPLKTGDLSLTLKKPLATESGSYTCTVCNKDGRILQQKVVILRVRATLKGTMADMLPCLRRRTAPKPVVKEELRDRNHEDVPLTAEETV